jgi:hypothetical protein
MENERRCPAHRQPLETVCRHCGRETPYILNASVLEAPFRCAWWCRSRYSYWQGSFLSCKPSMRKQDRTAISRRCLNRSFACIRSADPDWSEDQP